MRIFVTGGTGIVGSAAVPILRARGHDVLVMTRRAVSEQDSGYCQGDLSNTDALTELLSRFSPEAALHLGWEGLPDYSLTQTLRNLNYSVNFFIAAAAAGCKTIMSTGSCWEYAARTGQLNEDAPLSGGEPFHAAKNALRFIGEAVAATHGARFFWMRLFFVYGPGQRQQSLVPRLIDSIQHGKPPDLRAPYNRHDFIYVQDAARALADVLEQSPPETVYNVGSGQPTAVADIVATVHRLVDASPAESLTGSGPPSQDFWADVTRLKRDTGWQPTYGLEAGLRATLSGVNITD